jgi:hypothetical protein
MSQKHPAFFGGRGGDPADPAAFGPAALPLLDIARQEVQFLLDHGYPAAAVIDFVGGRHQLTARQRTALGRATAPRSQIALRQAAWLPRESARNGPLLVDGFNLIITLEVALCGNLLIRCGDGTLRDLAGLRGTYRLIPQTGQALALIGEALRELAVPAVHVYLDAPVSNSGRLRAAILESAAGWGLPAEVTLDPDPDRLLAGQAHVVSSDSLILDRCKSWFNLASLIVESKIGRAWIVDLSG